MGKDEGRLLSRLWTKVHNILRRCRRPLVNALAQLSMSVSFRRYRPLNLPLSCDVVQKGGFWSRFVGGWYTQISDMHFQIALTSEHVADFRWVPFSELRGSLTKKEEEEEEDRIRSKT